MGKPPYSESGLTLGNLFTGVTDKIEQTVDKVDRRQAVKGLSALGVAALSYVVLRPGITQNVSFAATRSPADIDEAIPSLDQLRLLAKYHSTDFDDDEELVEFDAAEAAEAAEYDDPEIEIQKFSALRRQPVKTEKITQLEAPEISSPLEAESVTPLIQNENSVPTTNAAKPIEAVVAEAPVKIVAKAEIEPLPEITPPLPQNKPPVPAKPGMPRSKPVQALKLAKAYQAPKVQTPKATISTPSLIIPSSGTRRIRIHAVNLNERETVTFAKNGRYDDRGLRELNYLFRDRHTGSVRKMDPRLYDQIFELIARVGDSSTEIKLISGYRTQKTNDRLRKRSGGVAKNSYHIKGQAVDFYLSNRKLKSLHKGAVMMGLGGVGYYPKSNFVHMDTGPTRSWPRRYNYLVDRYKKLA